MTYGIVLPRQDVSFYEVWNRTFKLHHHWRAKKHHRITWFIRCALCMLVFAYCHKCCCWQNFPRWDVCLLWEELCMWSNEVKLCFVGQTGDRINRIITEVLRVFWWWWWWMEKMHRIFLPPPRLYPKDSDSIFLQILNKFLPTCMLLHFRRY
jgi:hypothetical protein